MALPAFVFETERLGMAIALSTSEEDVQFNFLVRNQPKVVASTGGTPSQASPDKTRAFLKMRYETMYQKYGYGIFIIWVKPTAPGETARRVGTVGMVRAPNSEYPDVGYALLDEENGKGYATEAARGIIEYARTRCEVPAVLSFTASYNGASRRVLERAKLRQQAIVPVTVLGKVEDVVCFALGEETEGKPAEYYREIIQARLDALSLA